VKQEERVTIWDLQITIEKDIQRGGAKSAEKKQEARSGKACV